MCNIYEYFCFFFFYLLIVIILYPDEFSNTF